MTYIPDRYRQEIHSLAHRRCEYCLYDERSSEKAHETDHIVAEQHSGETLVANLCLACFECNRQKGLNLCSIDPETSKVTALFHPRQQRWNDHLRLEGAFIVPLIPTGRATVRALNLNQDERLSDRQRLIRVRRYPEFPES